VVVFFHRTVHRFGNETVRSFQDATRSKTTAPYKSDTTLLDYSI